MHKILPLICSLAVCLIAGSYSGVALSQDRAAPSDDLPPSPLEAFALRPTAKVVWSKLIGRIESKEARATITALIVEDRTQTPSRISGVRINLEHLVSNPNCDLIYPAWAILCRRANAAVYIESSRLEEVSTWILRGAAQLRPREYISEYHRGDGEGGLIICGYTLSKHQPAELADLLDTAIDQLRSARR